MYTNNYMHHMQCLCKLHTCLFVEVRMTENPGFYWNSVSLFAIFLILISIQNGVVNIVDTLWVLLHCMCSSAHFKASAIGLFAWKLGDSFFWDFIYPLLNVLISDINALMRKSGCNAHKHLALVEALRTFLIILNAASENTSQQPGFC